MNVEKAHMTVVPMLIVTILLVLTHADVIMATLAMVKHVLVRIAKAPMDCRELTLYKF